MTMSNRENQETSRSIQNLLERALENWKDPKWEHQPWKNSQIINNLNVNLFDALKFGASAPNILFFALFVMFQKYRE